MYPSLLHSFCIQVLDLYWEKNRTKLPPHPSKQCIKSLLYYSLKHLISTFNGDFFIKSAGIGQGEDYAAQLAMNGIQIKQETKEGIKESVHQQKIEFSITKIGNV